jgi:hypothetical protein
VGVFHLPVAIFNLVKAFFHLPVAVLIYVCFNFVGVFPFAGGCF